MLYNNHVALWIPLVTGHVETTPPRGYEAIDTINSNVGA